MGASPVVIDLHPVSIETLPDDADGQVECTLARMVRFARADADSPEIERDARQALASGRGNPLESVHSFIRGRMVFVTDEQQTARYRSQMGPDDYIVEALTRPRDVSKIIATHGQAQGDCDDFSMYCAAILTALKIPCAFCTVAASPAQPRDYSHVYVVAYAAGNRIPMDCSHGPRAGWETPNTLGRRREWPVYAGSPRSTALMSIGFAVALVALYKFSKGFTWLF